MTHMPNFEEINNDQNTAESENNTKLNTDLHDKKAINVHMAVDPSTTTETQSKANSLTESDNHHEEDSLMSVHKEICNGDAGLFVDANIDSNPNYEDNKSDLVTKYVKKEGEKESQELYDEVNEEGEAIKTQEDLSDEEAERRRLDSRLFENIPLFEVIRPMSMKEVIGQKHLINNHNGSIKNFIRLGYLPSMILHGPPGVGKTSIASILAKETGYVFVELSATDTTVSDLKELLSTIETENQKRLKRDTDYLRVVVFIDEIHRFTKIQQDFLLPFIELGVFTFIGATTLNPEIRIRRAIISRCQIFQLKALESDEIDIVIRKAITYENIRRRILRNLRSLSYSDECLNLLVKRSNGDTRAAVNLVELVSSHYNKKELKYDIGKHKPIFLDLNDLKKAIKSLKINLSGLQDIENLNLFLNLYDSMRHIKNARNIQPLPTLFNIIDAKKHGIEQFNSFKKNKSPCLHTKNNAKAVIHKSERNSLVMKFTIPSKQLGVILEANEEKPDLDKFSDYNEGFKDLQGDILKYNDVERSYISQMEVSDDSDVEAGPLYSDNEEDVSPIDITKLSLTDYFVLSSLHSLIMLLNRGETPFFIGKQLILFTAIYLKSDNSELGKTMALLKSLKHSNTNMLITLSNCVIRLTKTEKLSLSEPRSFIQKLKCIKRYCYMEVQRHNTKDKSHENALNGGTVEVIYNSKLIEELLNPVEEELPKTPNPLFEIESLEAFNDARLYIHIPQDTEDIDNDISENLYSTVTDITRNSLLPESSINELRVNDYWLDLRSQRALNSEDSDANETNLSLIKNPETQLE